MFCPNCGKENDDSQKFCNACGTALAAASAVAASTIASAASETAGPVEAAMPVTEVKPIQPVQPVQFTQPVQPVQPMQPVQPVQSVQQVHVAEPVQPMQSSQYGQSSQSSQAGRSYGQSQQQSYGEPASRPGDKNAKVSLGFGIASLVLVWTGLLPIIASIIGLVNNSKAGKLGVSSQGVKIAGLITNIFGMILGIGVLIVYIIYAVVIGFVYANGVSFSDGNTKNFHYSYEYKLGDDWD